MSLFSRFQRAGRGRNNKLIVATTDTGVQTLITARGTSYTIFVQRIVVTINTNAAQSITFQDSANTPVYVCKVTSGPGVDTRWEFVFGEKGFPLTQGKNLTASLSGAGLGAHIEWNAYETPMYT